MDAYVVNVHLSGILPDQATVLVHFNHGFGDHGKLDRMSELLDSLGTPTPAAET